VIFRGRVIAVHYVDTNGRPVEHVRWFNEQIAVFLVSDVWKGKIGHIISMKVNHRLRDCVGIKPDPGYEYIVYAFHPPAERNEALERLRSFMGVGAEPVHPELQPGRVRPDVDAEAKLLGPPAICTDARLQRDMLKIHNCAAAF
jgi:hypothetical protein